MTRAPSLVPVADHAVLVVFDGDLGDATLARIHALDTALSAEPPMGLTEIVPAMTTLLVVFDPVVTDHVAIERAVRHGLTAPAVERTGTTHVIDVSYEADDAPDIGVVAERAELDVADVVGAHVSATYTVGMYGFAPGYAYLYGTPSAIQLPRNPTPGPLVPAGSVIIAGHQCLITPIAMSTGWFAIGRTDAAMLTDDPDRPFAFDVGDTVTFRRSAP